MPSVSWMGDKKASLVPVTHQQSPFLPISCFVPSYALIHSPLGFYTSALRKGIDVRPCLCLSKYMSPVLEGKHCKLYLCWGRGKFITLRNYTWNIH